jgi:hypothetical protein
MEADEVTMNAFALDDSIQARWVAP